MIIKFIGDNKTLKKATVVYDIGIKLRNYVKEGNNTSRLLSSSVWNYCQLGSIMTLLHNTYHRSTRMDDNS